MTISKIVQFGLEDLALQLKEKGASSREIAQILSAESGKNINHTNVLNFFNRRTQDLREIAKKQVKLKSQIVQQEINVIDELRYINQKVKVAIEELEKDGSDPSRRAPLLAVLQRQTEFISKRLGEVSDAPQITILNQEFDKFQESVLSIVEEEGGRELRERILRRV
ncbi:MAG: hypothetical protein IB616_01180 [Methanosarcinales archaeon]|nr:MAG: hypothetical protein IB616_01180 [Methanosarcinales archaeon]